jgi:hypothetical protein
MVEHVPAARISLRSRSFVQKSRSCMTGDGRTASVPWMTIFHFKNGKIVSMVHLHDTLAEHEQLTAHKK